MNNTKDNKKNKIINYTIIVVCALAIALVIGYSFAWLTDIINQIGNSTIGEVKIEIYDGETKLNGFVNAEGSYQIGLPYAIMLGSKNTATNLNLQIKNTGNIDGIVRCLLTISSNEGPKDHQTDLDGALYLVQNSQADVLHPDWISLYDSEHVSGVYYYNAFLNKVLKPNETNKIITTITPLGDLENTTIYIRLRADIVAYSGNAYQVDSDSNPVQDKDKPFGNLSNEFLQQWTAWKE